MIKSLIKEMGASVPSGTFEALSPQCGVIWPDDDQPAVRVKLGQTPEQEHFLQREALWLQRIHRLMGQGWTHQCLGLERHGNTSVLITDYLVGTSLADSLRSQQCSELSWVTGALQDILTCLQQYNIVHGDIKPANLILTPDQRLILIDFANARRQGESLNERGFCQHTPSYQWCEDQTTADHQQDQYAATLCLQQLL